MDDLMDEKEMSVDKDAYRHVKRDWVTLLAPALIGALVSSVSSVAVCGYYMGGMNQRVVVLEEFKSHIAGDYMPKEQILRYMDQQEKLSDRITRTLERIEDRQEKQLDGRRP